MLPIKGARPYVILFMLSLHCIYAGHVIVASRALQTDFGIHIRWAINLPESTDPVIHVLLSFSFLGLLIVSCPLLTLTQSASFLAIMLLFMMPVPMIAIRAIQKGGGRYIIQFPC